MNMLPKLKKYRITKYDQYTPFVTTYLGFKCKALDKDSFLFTVKEIFLRQIYRFETKVEQSYIIDCGANIGLSTIYFKRLYPRAEIVAFEPYPPAIDAFEFNTNGLKNITLIKKGLSDKEGEIPFFAEGSDGSRIAVDGDKTEYNILTVKLSSFLDRKVDFLKIDIEGSEVAVLNECKDKLNNVERMFIEYHCLAKKPQELDEVLSIIKKAGFRYYIEGPDIRSNQPFIRIEQRLGYMMLLSIFCYR